MNELPQMTDDSLASLIGRVADEFVERLDRGENPQVENYVRQNPPEVAEALRDALNQVLLMRQSDLKRHTESPHVLGDFQIIREVGRGGMGVVYEAEQLSLGRRVALKVLPCLALQGSRDLRFINEAQAAARLHHTNIVPVYSVGVEGGVHYYAMQFIDGQTLDRVVAELSWFALPGTKLIQVESPPPVVQESGSHPKTEQSASQPDSQTGKTTSSWVGTLTAQHSSRTGEYYRTVARLGIEAAEALAHAHEHGIIHRDVKPGNMMVDDRGHLWITDFGLAQHQGQPHLTQTGDFLGTPCYVSPEQARGGRELLDHRTDVYSLGVTLYELLTLRRAFPGKNAREVLRQIERDEPRKPRRWNKAIPVELETIVLKAMEKKPADRYQSAQELADDLRRFLENKPIRAKPPTVFQHVRKWAERHSAAVAAAGTLVLTFLVVIAVVLGWSNQQLAEEKQKALTALGQKQDALTREQEALARKQEALDDNLRIAAKFAIDRGAWREGITRTEEALATERFRDSIPLRLDLARALLAVNDIDRARSEIKALAALPNLGEHEAAVLLLRGDLLLGRDDVLAERLLRQALTKGLSSADEAYARALLAETTPEAVDRLREALKLNPNLPRARSALELLLVLQARLGEAREEFAKHETIFPEDPNPKVLRAMVLALERDREGANQVLKEVGKSWLGVDVKALQALARLLSEFRNPSNPIDNISGLPNLTGHLPVLTPLVFRIWQGRFGTDFPIPPLVRKSLLTVTRAVVNAGGFGNNVKNDAKLIAELERATSVHPEGTIIYIHALTLFAAKKFPEARAVARKAAVTPALLPIRRQAHCIAALAGGMIYLGKRDPALRQELADDLVQMMAAGPLSEPYHVEFTIQLAWGINELNLARQLVAEWEKQAPRSPLVKDYRVTTEMRAGAYGPAFELASQYLQKGLQDSRIAKLQIEAVDKLQAQAQRLKEAIKPVAPAPREK
jgi:serine/threonine protein kinase